MKTKSYFVSLLLVLMALLLLTTAAAAQEEPDRVRLTIDNRTDQVVALSLTGPEARYYLAVAAGTKQIFTVVRDEYTHITLACGQTATGTVDISRQLQLNFTSCYVQPANQGEPGIEKIFLTESPTKTQWQYQYN